MVPTKVTAARSKRFRRMLNSSGYRREGTGARLPKALPACDRLPALFSKELPMTRRMVVGLLVMLTTGCAGAATPPADTRAQDEAAIRSAEVAWSASMQAKDVDKFVSFYAPDAVVMPQNEPTLTTPDAIKTSMA